MKRVDIWSADPCFGPVGSGKYASDLIGGDRETETGCSIQISDPPESLSGIMAKKVDPFFESAPRTRLYCHQPTTAAPGGDAFA